MKWVARALQEPLLHFLVLGSGLFALSYAFSESPAPQEPDKIVVSKQRLMNLILIFQRTWQRPPTTQELDAIVEEYVKEEILYREAMARELDRDDTKIRRLLRQKLEFVVEEMANAREPTDEELQRYLDEYPDSFRREQTFSFRQVYLSRAVRGDSLQKDATSFLDQLREGTVQASDIGDPSLLLPLQENVRDAEITAQFGPGFVEQLRKMDVDQWSGPAESAYGAHLVLILEKTAGRIPDLEEVRAAVLRDWIAKRRAESKEEFFQSLREKYEVIVEELDLTVGSSPTEADE